MIPTLLSCLYLNGNNNAVNQITSCMQISPSQIKKKKFNTDLIKSGSKARILHLVDVSLISFIPKVLLCLSKLFNIFVE